MVISKSENKPSSAKVIGFHELPLGSSVLRVQRSTLDIDDIVPNPRQPRQGEKEDEELQRQLIANAGIFQPLLVEPHPDDECAAKYRIIDGERRWTNARILVAQGRAEFREVPVEIASDTLSEEERLRVWVFIHRQRKEWDTREKESVAYALVDLVGRASASDILGVSVREIEKLVDVFDVSQRLTNLREAGASITWARELMGISKKLLTPEVMDAVVEKINRNQITNSKDLRKLRSILPDPVARSHFMESTGDIGSALLRVTTPTSTRGESGLAAELEAMSSAVKKIPWTDLDSLKGDSELLKKISSAEELLQGLRKTLST